VVKLLITHIVEALQRFRFQGSLHKKMIVKLKDGNMIHNHQDRAYIEQGMLIIPKGKQASLDTRSLPCYIEYMCSIEFLCNILFRFYP
jgi:hypothetical protein